MGIIYVVSRHRRDAGGARPCPASEIYGGAACRLYAYDVSPYLRLRLHRHGCYRHGSDVDAASGCPHPCASSDYPATVIDAC